MDSNGYALVAFDMDGVLVKYSSSWAWVHDQLGVDNKDSLKAFIEGTIDEKEFMRRDICLWRNKREDICISDVADLLKDLPLIDGIGETIDELHANGIKCVIVSGGLEIAASRIASMYHFDGYAANSLECDAGGRLTGEGLINVNLSEKIRTLIFFQERYSASKERTVAIGNSFVDVSMFNGSAMSIAFNPIDELVEKSADIIIRSSDIHNSSRPNNQGPTVH